MLTLIGLGLAGPTDITVRGLEAVKQADLIYLEGYTSLLRCSPEELEGFYGRKIIFADRQVIENGSQKILDEAKQKKVVVLVIGDPLSATTHTGLLLDAKEEGVPFEVIHNASVLTAVGETGLQLYKFGRTASMPWHPTDVPYDILEKNKNTGLHTLYLLDLDPADKCTMSAKEAAKRLLDLEAKHKKKVISAETLALACVKLGWPEQRIIAAPLGELAIKDLPGSPQCLIIPGEIHFLEEEWLQKWRI